MKAIVAVDKNWGIGYQGELLVSIPADHKFFRQETMGKVVVYGRKTLETFPEGRVLSGRTNIILSRNSEFEADGAVVVHSEPELMKELEKYETDDIYIIGGASVYKLMLPHCDTVHVTKIDHSYQADAFFPNLDNMPQWQITGDSDEQTYFDLIYHFYRYEKKKD